MKSTFRKHCFSLSRRFQNGDFCIFVRRGFLIFRCNFPEFCKQMRRAAKYSELKDAWFRYFPQKSLFLWKMCAFYTTYREINLGAICPQKSYMNGNSANAQPHQARQYNKLGSLAAPAGSPFVLFWFLLIKKIKQILKI